MTYNKCLVTEGLARLGRRRAAGQAPKKGTVADHAAEGYICSALRLPSGPNALASSDGPLRAAASQLLTTSEQERKAYVEQGFKLGAELLREAHRTLR